MNSEKVKEIKKALKLNEYFAIEYFSKSGESKIFTFTDLLTLINELESEKERLKEENRILLDKDTLLEMVGLLSKEKDILLNRISDLEKENATKTDTIADLLKKQEFYEVEKLKQFAEMLKEKLFDLGNIVNENDIDETLKEFTYGKV